MTASERCFDRYVAVDWSASNQPSTGRDSIWIAVLPAGGDVRWSNPPTRHRAALEIDEFVAGSERTLLVVDASLGYPRGSAAWFGLDGGPGWAAAWRHLEGAVVDDERNRSNRFEVAAAMNRRTAPAGGHVDGGPFWGRHRVRDIPGLEPTRPATFPVPEFRACDEWLRTGGRRPASVWQLLGAGSVGSQSVTLIPILERLRRRMPAEVWPFTTGLRAPVVPPGGLVVAEMWPSAFEIDMPLHWIRDAAQVHGVAHELAAADDRGELAGWFEPDVAPADRRPVVDEEGWMLGVSGNAI